MREMLIAGLGTYSKFGCYLGTGWTLEEAKVKTLYKDLPGGDGVLDFTEALAGMPRYNTRKLSFTLIMPSAAYSEYRTNYDELTALWHGKRLDIIIPDDEEYKLVGRVSVGALIMNKAQGNVNVTADCDPWRLKKELSRATCSIPAGGEKYLTVHNKHRPSCPAWLASEAVRLTVGSTSFALAANTEMQFPALTFGAGATEILIAGKAGANITATWQEARL